MRRFELSIVLLSVFAMKKFNSQRMIPQVKQEVRLLQYISSVVSLKNVAVFPFVNSESIPLNV